MARRRDLDTEGWARQRERVMARDGYQCVQCHAAEDLTVDHIIPHAVDPGSRDDVDLATLCRTCNGRKADRLRVRLDYRAEGWF